jgi:hypothetical protein
MSRPGLDGPPDPLALEKRWAFGRAVALAKSATRAVVKWVGPLSSPANRVFVCLSDPPVDHPNTEGG